MTAEAWPASTDGMCKLSAYGGRQGFLCAICGRQAWSRWPGAIQLHPVEPVCRSCEIEWGVGAQPAGAFRDRRIVGIILALANALETEARQKFYRRYGFGAP